MKRLIKWLIVLGVLGGGVALLIVKARPQPPVVQVEPVRRGSLSGTVSSVSSGMVEPTRRVTLQAESVARVTAVRIKRGDRVKAGAVLVELNAADLAGTWDTGKSMEYVLKADGTFSSTWTSNWSKNRQTHTGTFAIEKGDRLKFRKADGKPGFTYKIVSLSSDKKSLTVKLGTMVQTWTKK